jgi:hypothetical protein
MTSLDLAVLICTVGAAVILVFAVGFVIFSRFLKKEKEIGDRFRGIPPNHKP